MSDEPGTTVTSRRQRVSPSKFEFVDASERN